MIEINLKQREIKVTGFKRVMCLLSIYTTHIVLQSMWTPTQGEDKNPIIVCCISTANHSNSLEPVAKTACIRSGSVRKITLDIRG